LIAFCFALKVLSLNNINELSKSVALLETSIPSNLREEGIVRNMLITNAWKSRKMAVVTGIVIGTLMNGYPPKVQPRREDESEMCLR